MSLTDWSWWPVLHIHVGLPYFPDVVLDLTYVDQFLRMMADSGVFYLLALGMAVAAVFAILRLRTHGGGDD